nr:hypothetical protein [Tanacetum cinerariifolium]
MHQPWRSFAAIINKYLSGKTTGHDSLRLSRAQIIWGMYHNKNVDYVYLLWEDLVYQVENKNSKKKNDMCYLRFTKFIIDYIMKKDLSIPRRNKRFWHTARDDPMFTMIRKSSDDEEDDDDDNSNDEDDDGQDDDNEQTWSDNDGDDFVHPKLSTFDEEERRVNVKEEKLDEEKTNKEEKVNELYDDMNINLFISNMLNPNLDTKTDSILNLNIESTSLIDVPVTMNVEIPPSSVKTLPPPPIPLVQPQHQTPVLTPGIVPNRLRDKSQAKNKDFINKLDENIKKIMNEQVKVKVKEQVSKIFPRTEKLVNEQLEAEVLTRSSNKAKTPHTLCKALIDTYETDKVTLDTYRDTVTFKRRQDDEDNDEEPFAGSNWWSKRRRARKEPESSSAPKEKTSESTGKSKAGSKSHQKSIGKSA